MKLVYLATAPDQITAEIWVSLLRDNGIGAMVRPSDAVSFLGVAAFGTRVLVDEDRVEEAREVIGEDET